MYNISYHVRDANIDFPRTCIRCVLYLDEYIVRAHSLMHRLDAYISMLHALDAARGKGIPS